MTPRLTLQPLGPEHAAALFPLLRDAELYRFIPGEPPHSAARLAARYRRTAAGPRSPSERWYNWAVSLREALAAPLGTVELSLFDDGLRASLAYIFARTSWGQGIASQACGAAIEYLRRQTPVRSISALIDTRNVRSIALAERLGFTRAATIENADYFKGSTSHEYDYRLALMEDDHGEIEQR